MNSVKASVVYRRGIPSWRESFLETVIQRGTNLELTSDALQVTRGKQALCIPIASIRTVSLQRGFMDNMFAVMYVDPSTGQETTAAFKFPGVKGGSVIGERIVEQLRSAGVSETEFRYELGEAEAERATPQPGLFPPWYVREAGPLVVKKYDDNWTSRNNMNREIQEAAKSGWAVQQTQTVGGHVNVGWVIMLILFFWTIVIPFVAIFNLRTPGHFVVTFEKKTPFSSPAAHNEPLPSATSPSRDLSAAFRHLKELRDLELITQEEFENKRRQLIEEAFPGPSRESA